MRRLAIGSLVILSIVVVACVPDNGPPNAPAPGQQPYGAPPAYGQPGAPQGYPQQPAYGAPPYGQPQAYGQPGAPAPYGQPGVAPPPAYGQPPQPMPGQPMPGQPLPPAPNPGAPPMPGAPAGATMAVPGMAAFPCSNDAACGLAHCNTQYGKCAFPCVDPSVDCIQGAGCVAGFCVPKLPGT